MQPLLHQLNRGVVVALAPQPPEQTPAQPAMLRRRWHSPREVADMLGFGLSKVKALIATGELKSIKDGRYRRILPEWVDEYVASRVRERGL